MPVVEIVTTGDRIQDRRLLEVGGKALFTNAKLWIPLGIAYSSKLADSRIHLLGDTGVAATYSSILWILAIIAAAGIAIFLIADHRLGRSSV